MKKLIFVLALLVAGKIWGQDEPFEKTFKMPIPSWANETLVLEPAEKPNEIPGRNVIYDGIFIQLIKMDNPAQLINPLASPEYGNGYDNLSQDIITKKETGLKFFSIKF